MNKNHRRAWNSCSPGAESSLTFVPSEEPLTRSTLAGLLNMAFGFCERVQCKRSHSEQVARKLLSGRECPVLLTIWSPPPVLPPDSGEDKDQAREENTHTIRSTYRRRRDRYLSLAPVWSPPWYAHVSDFAHHVDWITTT